MDGLRTLFLTCLAMLAFSANSLLAGERSPATQGRWLSALALFVYAAAFSFAYVTVSAATGALILFAAVQATMLSYAIARGERLNPLQVAGLAVSVAGFVALCWRPA